MILGKCIHSIFLMESEFVIQILQIGFLIGISQSIFKSAIRRGFLKISIEKNRKKTNWMELQFKQIKMKFS